MRFSDEEVKQIAKAWVIVSLAFTIVRFRLNEFFSPAFLIAFVVSAITVGLGFILHELAHKYFAQKYGAWAEFRAFDQFLLLGLILSFFGGIFILPGAVFIRGVISTKRNGIISVAGPVTNVVLGVLFLLLVFAFPSPFLTSASLYGMQINFWLGLFNMLPIWQIDGAKVWVWNKAVWGLVFVAAMIGAFFPPYFLKIL